MRNLMIIGLFGLAAQPLLADSLKPSMPVKVYQGSDGVKVSTLEVDDGKQVIMRLEGVGGEREGKTFLLNVRTSPHAHKDYYYETKRGSKMVQHDQIRFREDSTVLIIPERAVDIYYSEKASKTVESADLLKAAEHPAELK